MKRIILLITSVALALLAEAGITRYQFTSVRWQSSVDGSATDGKSDGWTSDKDGSSYTKPATTYYELHQNGVKVEKAASGAGATSVKSFTDVRSITINYAQNAQKGKGVIHVQVGGYTDSICLDRPIKTSTWDGTYNRDTTLWLDSVASGKITFRVTCSESSLYIHSLTIRAKEGGSTPFTMATYQLVTDAGQLRDSDQIIIGVHKDKVNYIMGYFDEEVSQNNIHAIKGSYGEGRTSVSGDERAIYTLRRGVTSKGDTAWVIQDELRYEEAYLVASGGKTKNVLALWNHCYDEKSYGDYGYWDIQVAADGQATVVNKGNSVGKYLQYNASNSPTLFGCYASMSQTAVSIYREEQAIGDEPGIRVRLVNFGTAVLSGDSVVLSKRVTVHANRLTESIHVSLSEGAPFFLSTETLDQDGDDLTLRAVAKAAGTYIDTLILTANGIRETAVVILHVAAEQTVAEAKAMSDYSEVYLHEVVVTKKNDRYIFVRDTTGSILIFDPGDGTGKRYGADLERGDVLRGVTGRYKNYYGVPELSPSAHWSVKSLRQECLPDTVERVDSADVCRYICLKDVVIEEQSVEIGGKVVAVDDPFGIGIEEGVGSTLNAIVYIDHDTLTLWACEQVIQTTGVRKSIVKEGARKIIVDGQVYLLDGRRRMGINGAIMRE